MKNYYFDVLFKIEEYDLSLSLINGSSIELSNHYLLHIREISVRDDGFIFSKICFSPSFVKIFGRIKSANLKTCLIGSFQWKVKPRYHTRFQRAFNARCCVFKEITLVCSDQRNYFENANACN